MTLEDHQTGKDIISPYLLIGQKGSTGFAINTETFSRCQEWLVLDETFVSDFRSEQFRGLSDSRVAPVFAVVGDYNTGMTSPVGIGRTVSLGKPSQIEYEIGFIPLEILRREVPRVYDSVKRAMESPKREAVPSCLV